MLDRCNGARCGVTSLASTVAQNSSPTGAIGRADVRAALLSRHVLLGSCSLR